jgi:hypothetical protein
MYKISSPQTCMGARSREVQAVEHLPSKGSNPKTAKTKQKNLFSSHTPPRHRGSRPHRPGSWTLQTQPHPGPAGRDGRTVSKKSNHFFFVLSVLQALDSFNMTVLIKCLVHFHLPFPPTSILLCALRSMKPNRGQICQPRVGVNKVLLEHSHGLWFPRHLWLLSCYDGRAEEVQWKPLTQSLTVFTAWPFNETPANI